MGNEQSSTEKRSLDGVIEEITITFNMILAEARDRGHADGWPRLSQLKTQQQQFLDWAESSGATLEPSVPGSLRYQYYDRPDIYSKFTEGAADLCEILKRLMLVYRQGEENPDRPKDVMELLCQTGKLVAELRELTQRGKSPPWEP